jgi:uncharacterized protein (DUF1697 family)
LKYISVLRGINVSGHKKIKMADLKILYESLGFNNIVTYIQSGNVLFDSDKTDSDLLKSTIEKAIESQYDFFVPVIIRTEDDFAELIRINPFSPNDIQEEGTKVLVTFLSEPAAGNSSQLLEKYRAASESVNIRENHIYLHCPEGYGKTKLSNNLIEKKLHTEATTRNWKTVLKLYELSKDRQGDVC